MQELNRLFAEATSYIKKDVVNEPELFFDESKRIIQWTGGIVKISRKRFLFLKTLWNAKKYNEDKIATIAELEEQVWDDVGDSPQNMFIAKNRLFGLLFHLQNFISSVNFPYKIESVKNFSTGELLGYRLLLR
ncbi:MAG: hypothetical protein LBT05_04360 [Planctomycetaceae bacterium]|nr:hypothetical protein [Planctomycetaceae bacterium]